MNVEGEAVVFVLGTTFVVGAVRVRKLKFRAAPITTTNSTQKIVIGPVDVCHGELLFILQFL